MTTNKSVNLSIKDSRFTTHIILLLLKSEEVINQITDVDVDIFNKRVPNLVAKMNSKKYGKRLVKFNEKSYDSKIEQINQYREIENILF